MFFPVIVYYVYARNFRFPMGPKLITNLKLKLSGSKYKTYGNNEDLM